MRKPEEFTCCRGYAYGKILNSRIADKERYIPISLNRIEKIKRIVQKKGVEVKTIRKGQIMPSQDYLFYGNLVKINPFLTSPNIEIHSETKEDLENLIRELGL